MKLTEAQKQKLVTFGWRMWNTFKSVILPIALPVIYIRMQNSPDDLSPLLDMQLWESVLYAVIIALIGSAIAGFDKLRRV